MSASQTNESNPQNTNVALLERDPLVEDQISPEITDTLSNPVDAVITPEQTADTSQEVQPINGDERVLTVKGLVAYVPDFVERAHTRKDVNRLKKANNIMASEQYMWRRAYGDDIGTDAFEQRIRSSDMTMIRKFRALRANKAYKNNIKDADELYGKIGARKTLKEAKQFNEAYVAAEADKPVEKTVVEIPVAPKRIAYHGLMANIAARMADRAGKKVEKYLRKSNPEMKPWEIPTEPNEKYQDKYHKKLAKQTKWQRVAQDRRLTQSRLRKETKPVDVSGWASTAPQAPAESSQIEDQTEQVDRLSDYEEFAVAESWFRFEKFLNRAVDEAVAHGESRQPAYSRLRKQILAGFLSNIPEDKRSAVVESFKELSEREAQEQRRRHIETGQTSQAQPKPSKVEVPKKTPTADEIWQDIESRVEAKVESKHIAGSTPKETARETFARIRKELRDAVLDGLSESEQTELKRRFRELDREAYKRRQATKQDQPKPEQLSPRARREAERKKRAEDRQALAKYDQILES